jgi:formate hydrogenlyase subunit 6/NADH:ubiquinone oxidoreductase subunit I
MGKTSLCGLGQSASNPVLTTLKYFQNEYKAHINESKCPALVCSDLLYFSIDQETCTLCGLCLKNCPADAITGKRKSKKKKDPGLPFNIHMNKCIQCSVCFNICPASSVIKSSGKEKAA